MTALLQARDVTRRFAGLTAVSEVNLTIEQGAAIGLIGANGAGKTTLFNCLTGFDRPTSGDVLLRGSSLLGIPRHKVVRAGVARTFQIVRPFPDLPVLANVMVPLIAAGRKGDLRAEAMAVLARVGLADRATSPSSQLSEGDLKRLEMARALATRPSLLLLDEPFAGLSHTEIELVSGTIGQLRRDGVTLVVVEHKIGALLALVDRVVAMDQGSVIADGEPEAVMRDPAVVRAYLGEPTDGDAAESAAETSAATRDPVAARAAGPTREQVVTASRPERVLEVRDLGVAFGKAQVLDGLSLHVDRGESVAVVGPNGAGKTTLLRALSRLNTSSAETLNFQGRALPASPYGVAMAGLVHCPERRRLFPGLSVRDNLELGARRLHKGDNTRREDLEKVFALFPKLQEREHQLAGTLSGGEQQQCAIGRALMARPVLLLLDEPTLGLSVGVKEAIIAGISTIKDSGTTMLLVEQDVSFAFRCADRVIVLEHGSVAREGTVEQIAADPYVRQAYLGVS